MSEEKGYRLGQVARKLNVGLNTVADYLASKGQKVDHNPNARITEEHYQLLLKEFQSSFQDKKEASELVIGGKRADIPPVRASFEQSAPEKTCLLYTSPSPRDGLLSRMPSSA